MTKRCLLATGCDAQFYPFMDEALRSLFAVHAEDQADIAILDLGLTEEQRQSLQARGCALKPALWSLDVPKELQLPHMAGLVARTTLRDDFPGYQVYLWFDADAWAQTPEFLTLMIEGAMREGAAIVRENGPQYRRDYLYNRWWYGHMIAAYGLVKGFAIAFPPAINIGILALRADAPHWQLWRQQYQFLIHHRQRINMDQHAFNAALALHQLPAYQAPARCNWICTLSTPWQHSESGLYCEPVPQGRPLSVLHLAGKDKRREYNIKQDQSHSIQKALTYSAYVDLI